MRLAGEGNKYLEKNKQWVEIKTDKAAAATTVYTALRAIDSLKVLFSPFLPFTCEKLHSYLGYTQPFFGEQFLETRMDKLGEHQALRYSPAHSGGRWEPSWLPAGQVLQEPAPLYRKLDEIVAEEERARLGQASTG